MRFHPQPWKTKLKLPLGAGWASPALLTRSACLPSNRSLTGAGGSQSSFTGKTCEQGGRVGSRWWWPFTGGKHSPWRPLWSSRCSKGTTESSLNQRLCWVEPSHKSKSTYPFDVGICHTAFLTSHCWAYTWTPPIMGGSLLSHSISG